MDDIKSSFVSLSEYVPDILLDVRYYSSYNFVGERIDGYQDPIVVITKEAAEKIRIISCKAMSLGFRLKVFDAYRPQSAVNHFVRWAKSDDVSMKKYFYPDVDKKNLFSLGYIAEKSGHSRGSTIDLTLFDMNKGQDADMGGCFDYFGALSHSDYDNLTDEQKNNRAVLRNLMTRNGFVPLKEEWWHYTLRDEPYPDTYFNFDVAESSLR